MTQCRLRLRYEGKPYPRSGCKQCNWSVLTGNIHTMCTDPNFSGGLPVDDTERLLEYKSELQKWVDTICKHSGLQMHVPEHRPLILMYTMLAKTCPDSVDQGTVHDAWALWTMFIRNLPDHPNMVPFEDLDNRTKMLDKIDWQAMLDTAKECSDAQ